jgi:GDP-4-dehydro-6-deoxy-D-mannose reductase
MRALVTGASGFAGSHLAALLARAGHEVVGTTTTPQGSLAHMDLRDRGEVDDVVRRAAPERVWHLAAQSRAGLSWERPALTYDVNVAGTHNVLEAVRRHAPGARVLLACTSDAYGLADDPSPFTESSPLRPLSPYAASKVAAEWVGRMFVEAHGLHVVVTRAFYHVGPGQPASFAVANWARRIALAEAGMTEPVIPVGNLDLRRDIGDVRDVVRAYRELLEHAAPGEVFNVATGTTRTLRDVLATLTAASTAALRVEVDGARVRPADPPVLAGDASKLRERTGWRPAIALEETLAEVLAGWRAEVRADQTLGVGDA